jgi:hypothetical protein
MGLGDLIDGIGDAVEGGFDDVVNGAKHVIGTAVDDGAHVLGTGLNAVGLHGAAQAVDNFGDSAADHLGDQVAEKQLGQTTDPTQLVHGDLNAIQTAAARLANFGSAFHETAQGLAGIDTTHWQGQAADAFRAHYQQHPKQWGDTADACTTAASAWNTYGDAVLAAQQQARKAIDLYQQGTQATAQAQARYNQAVATFTQQATAYNSAAAQGQDPGPMPQAPATFSDPGAAARTQAQQILTTARQQRDTAGGQAQQAITHAASTFPAVPAFTQRMSDDASDTLTTAAVEGEHLVGGVAKGVGSMVKFVRGVDPLDPYNVTHPAAYIDHMSQTAAGLVHVALHPQNLVTGLVGSGWSSDPAQALGELIPNVVAAVGTDGMSGAAEGAMDAGKVAEVAGDTAANAGRTAAEDLGSVDSMGPHSLEPEPGPAHAPTAPAMPSAGQAMTDMTGPAGSWGEFGPQGDPGLSAADHAAAGAVDTAGSGLGDAEKDLSQIHVNGGTQLSASEAPAASATPIHTVPSPSLSAKAAPDAAAANGMGDVGGGTLSTLQRRLQGLLDTGSGPAATAGGQEIGEASTDLGRAEHDLDDITVHDPGWLDPGDPDFRAVGADHQAYLDDHPTLPETQDWLDQVRSRYPQANGVPDAELRSLDNYKTSAWHINKAMRTGDTAALNELNPEIRNVASALNRLPPFAGKVVRGIDVPDANDLRAVIGQYTPKTVVRAPSFTSADKGVPSAGNVEFYIDSTQGRDISFLMEPGPGPQEVVFPPDTNFSVESRTFNEVTKKWEIHLKDVGR